jgi:hypothetical protein
MPSTTPRIGEIAVTSAPSAYWASFEPGTEVIVVSNGGINRSASGLRSSSLDATMPINGVPP